MRRIAALTLIVAACAVAGAAAGTQQHLRGHVTEPDTMVVAVPSSCSQSGNCREALGNALTRCANLRAACTVQLDGGMYSMHGGAHTMLENTYGGEQLTLDGGGATLMAQNLTGFFTFVNVTGLTVRNLTLDMARTPYTYGAVVSATPNSFVLSVDASQYPFAADNMAWLTQVQAVLQYDPTADRMAVNAVDVYCLPPNQKNATWDASTSRLTVQGLGSNDGIRQGIWLIVRHQVYSFNAFSIVLASNVVLEHITMYNAPGMGAYFQRTTNVMINNVNVQKPSGRPMSITADAVHFQSCNGTIEIANSVFEGQGDDGLNVHSNYADVEGMSGSNIVTLGKNGQPEMVFAGVGETVQFRSRQTFQPYSQLSRVVASTTVNGLTQLTLDGIDPGVSKYDLMLGIDWMPSVHIHDCTYKNNRARGQLVKTNNVLLERNVYDHTSGVGVQADPDGCYWFESNPVKNWTLRDSTFIGNNFGPGQAGGYVWLSACVPTWVNGEPTTNGGPPKSGQVHSNVNILNCQFQQDNGLSSPAVAVTNVNGLTVAGNVITGGVAGVNFQSNSGMNARFSNNTCNGSTTCNIVSN